MIGNGTATEQGARAAEELGGKIIERGWRLVTGGLGGVMEAASRGAHRAESYREGDVVGLLPGPDPRAANRWVDIVLPTNMGFARNVLVVSMADAVVAVGGGAGTLTEMAMAWQLDRPLIGLQIEGWSAKLAGQAVDARPRQPILRARDAEQAANLLADLFTR